MVEPGGERLHAQRVYFGVGLGSERVATYGRITLSTVLNEIEIPLARVRWDPINSVVSGISPLQGGRTPIVACERQGHEAHVELADGLGRFVLVVDEVFHRLQLV